MSTRQVKNVDNKSFIKPSWDIIRNMKYNLFLALFCCCFCSSMKTRFQHHHHMYSSQRAKYELCGGRLIPNFHNIYFEWWYHCHSILYRPRMTYTVPIFKRMYRFSIMKISLTIWIWRFPSGLEIATNCG